MGAVVNGDSPGPIRGADEGWLDVRSVQFGAADRGAREVRPEKMGRIDRQVDEVPRAGDEALVDAGTVEVRTADHAAGAGVCPIDVVGADRQTRRVAGPGDETLVDIRAVQAARPDGPTPAVPVPTLVQ